MQWEGGGGGEGGNQCRWWNWAALPPHKRKGGIAIFKTKEYQRHHEAQSIHISLTSFCIQTNQCRPLAILAHFYNYAN